MTEARARRLSKQFPEDPAAGLRLAMGGMVGQTDH